MTFCEVDIFCHVSVCYVLMDALALLFLQKKHNRLRSINKSFNLVMPCAKLKSHIYLAKNKALLASDIFSLTWCDDLWPLPSVSCIWQLIHMEESELLNDLGSSPRLHGVICWPKTPRLYTVHSPALPPCDPWHCGFHMERIFTPRLLSLSLRAHGWRQTETGRTELSVVSHYRDA